METSVVMNNGSCKEAIDLVRGNIVKNLMLMNINDNNAAPT
jgi:hypothetical protein